MGNILESQIGLHNEQIEGMKEGLSHRAIIIIDNMQDIINQLIEEREEK